MSTGDPEAADPPRPPSVDTDDDPPEPRGGSGTAGPPSDEKDQAGSYARDAEQDPEGERHGRSDADR